MIVELLLGTALSFFPIGTAAQQPEHHPEQSSPKPPMSGGMMSQEMMVQHQKMMAQHQEFENLIDQLVRNFSALEKEKDAALLRKRLVEESTLLKDLQSKFRQTSGMMGQMMEHSRMVQPGEQAMGFSQTQTTHHFFLRKDGGIIQVEANDPIDTQNRDLIRIHLSHIAQAFAVGDFSDPLVVHDKFADGVPVMQRLKGDIHYTFEQIPQGGRVLIHTANAQAVEAIHQFLRFQIKEHQTGDSVKVE
jgi:hypothetical protein